MSGAPPTGRWSPVAALQALLAFGAFTLLPRFVPYALVPLAIVLLAAAWPPAVPWRPLRARAVLRVYLPFAVAWLVFVILYLRAAHWLGHTIAPQPQLAELAEHGASTPGFAMVCFAIVVVAPVCEEIVFRGYLQTALRGIVPDRVGLLATSALFGLAHGPDYALPIGVLALAFGWLRLRYDALLPAIFAHAVHNGLTVAVTLLWPGHLELLYPR
jgi:membrane protease YdiL (CAAX protease family)